MAFPALTSVYAAILSLFFAGLSGWVVAGRLTNDVLIGDGGKEQFLRRMRAHANFAEYVPLILLLAALLEAGGASHLTIHGLLAPLVVARIAHPIGMLAPPNSLQQFSCRGASVVVTLAILVVAAVLLLVRAA